MKTLKNKRRIIRYGVTLLVLFLVVVCGSAPVFAGKCGGTETSLIDCGSDEGGIWHILSLVLDILSIGIGIVGVVGISIAGVQYLTAGGSEEQAKKAKNRILQIVIGLAVYALIFVALEWLMPGGIINSESNLAKVGSTSEIEEARRQQEEIKKQAENNNTKDSNGSTNQSEPTTELSNGSSAKKISDTAWEIVTKKLDYDKVAKETGYYGYMASNCSKIGGGDCNRGNKGYRTFCSGFTYNVLRYTGVDPSFPMMTGKQASYASSSSNWKDVTSKVNGKTSKLKPGDLLINPGQHTLLITQNSKGQLYTAQAAVGSFEPKKSKIASKTKLDNAAGNLSKYKVFRIVE